MIEPYRIPVGSAHSEIVIRRSRFLSTVRRASTVPAARDAIAELRADLPGASHYVYAFRVGFGNSVVEGMSDDGEPKGTAGPPSLAIVRGSDIGDILLVTARYFGGTKLGAGGLVRAYSESAKLALSRLSTTLKIERRLVGIELPYAFYNMVKLLIEAHKGDIEEVEFAGDVLVTARFQVHDLDHFSRELRERSSGRISPVLLD